MDGSAEGSAEVAAATHATGFPGTGADLPVDAGGAAPCVTVGVTGRPSAFASPQSLQ